MLFCFFFKVLESEDIIDNASSIKYSNEYYILINPDTGKLYVALKKLNVNLSYNAEYWCETENNYYILGGLKDRNKPMKKEADNDKITEKKKYIPQKNHPWRKNMILR